MCSNGKLSTDKHIAGTNPAWKCELQLCCESAVVNCKPIVSLWHTCSFWHQAYGSANKVPNMQTCRTIVYNTQITLYYNYHLHYTHCVYHNIRCIVCSLLMTLFSLYYTTSLFFWMPVCVTRGTVSIGF